MLIWRATSPEYPNIYYMWSTDYGVSWSRPETIPGVVSREWNTDYDMYDLATDNAGHIHLLVTGYRSTKRIGPRGVLHLTWDGKGWSTPVPVFEGSWYPEYLHLVIDRGNQLHATWFIRQDPMDNTVPHETWYAHGQSQALAETPAALPTRTPIPPTPTRSTTATPTPYPTLNPEDTGLPEGLYTESDDVLQLAIALSPAAIVILMILAVKMGWLGRLRR